MMDTPLLGVLPDLPQALCREVDPELWQPEPGSSSEAAKRICARCPEIEACLAFALDHPQVGLWGGTTAHERGQIRRQYPTSGVRYASPRSIREREASAEIAAGLRLSRNEQSARDRATAISLRGQGWTVARIVAHMGLSTRTVERYLQAARDVA